MRKNGNWKRVLTICVFILNVLGCSSQKPKPKNNDFSLPDSSLLQLSEKLLYAVKTKKSTNDFEAVIASTAMEQLVNGLNNDNAIKTFWLNMYNAWYQILAQRERLKNPKIFTKKAILIAGHTFSLDDIEHGILRRYRWKYSKGYFASFFPEKLIKQLAVSQIDYRIHFALNCGAKSCPPIAFYKYSTIEQQLDVATKTFLNAEIEFDDSQKELQVTKIMDWFIADFGGKKGIKEIIKKVLNKEVSNYSIHFKPYNWDEALSNFVE
jgi:hypothetical protein